MTREQKSARMLLSGFNMAFDMVKKYSYSETRIGEVLSSMEMRQIILEEMAGIRPGRRAK